MHGETMKFGQNLFRSCCMVVFGLISTELCSPWSSKYERQCL